MSLTFLHPFLLLLLFSSMNRDPFVKAHFYQMKWSRGIAIFFSNSMVTILKCWSQKPSESEQFFYRKHLYSLQGLQRTQCLHFFIEYVHCREEGYIGLYNVHPYRPKDFPRPDNQQLKLYLMKIRVGSKCFSITQSSSKLNGTQALSVSPLFTDVRDYSANYRMRN